MSKPPRPLVSSAVDTIATDYNVATDCSAIFSNDCDCLLIMSHLLGWSAYINLRLVLEFLVHYMQSDLTLDECRNVAETVN